MQIAPQVIGQLEGNLKRYLPVTYADKIAKRLTGKGLNVSRDEVYNFLNGKRVKHTRHHFCAALELISNARKARLQAENTKRIIKYNYETQNK